MTSFVVMVLSLLTLIADVFLIFTLFSFLLSIILKKEKLLKKVEAYFRSNKILYPLIVAIIATGGSLFFSEIAGFVPCKLCWYQRIFMYPQVLLLFLAYFWNDIKIFRYTISLSIIGAFIAIRHYILQTGNFTSTSCAIGEPAGSCSQKVFAYFGYITIPMMSLTAFILLIVFSIIQLRAMRQRKK